MASLYYCPAIVVGGGEPYWLPPWLRPRYSRTQSVVTHSPKGADRAIITSVTPNQGTRISLTIDRLRLQPTDAQVLSVLDDLWTMLAGQDRRFVFFEFSDRGWADCAMESFDYSHDDPLRLVHEVGIQIFSEVSQPSTFYQLQFEDYASEYPFAAYVGRPTGTAASPGTRIPLSQNAMILPGTFIGIVESATVAGQEHRFTVGGVPGTQWKLEGLQITHADPVNATGTTTVRVATYGVGDVPGSHIEAAVESDEWSGDEETGDITVTTGDTLFVYVPAAGAGGHQNVQFRVRLRQV